MTIPDMTVNKKEYLTIGQLLFVQLGLHIKLEDSSQGKTLALVNIDRDPFHLQYWYWYCQYWYSFCQYLYWFCSSKYRPFSPSRLSPAFCDSPPLQREHPRQPLIREISLLNDYVVLYQPPGVILFYPFFSLSKLRIKPVQRIPDLLAEKVFALFQLLVLFEQPHWKILNWEVGTLSIGDFTLNVLSPHRPHWQGDGSDAPAESGSPGTSLLTTALDSSWEYKPSPAPTCHASWIWALGCVA